MLDGSQGGDSFRPSDKAYQRRNRAQLTVKRGEGEACVFAPSPSLPTPFAVIGPAKGMEEWEGKGKGEGEFVGPAEAASVYFSSAVAVGGDKRVPKEGQ